MKKVKIWAKISKDDTEQIEDWDEDAGELAKRQGVTKNSIYKAISRGYRSYEKIVFYEDEKK